jgi:prevent-host-death family protein
VTDIPLRELRNHTSEVLRRVEDGESMTVTVSGRPVAQLVPLPRRRRFISWSQFQALHADNAADRQLLDELHEIDPPQEEQDPWERYERRHDRPTSTS